MEIGIDYVCVESLEIRQGGCPNTPLKLTNVRWVPATCVEQVDAQSMTSGDMCHTISFETLQSWISGEATSSVIPQWDPTETIIVLLQWRLEEDGTLFRTSHVVVYHNPRAPTPPICFVGNLDWAHRANKNSSGYGTAVIENNFGYKKPSYIGRGSTAAPRLEWPMTQEEMTRRQYLVQRYQVYAHDVYMRTGDPRHVARSLDLAHGVASSRLRSDEQGFDDVHWSDGV